MKETLWTLSWWPSLEGYAGNMKITTHKELIDRIERPPRTPYVYLAIWKTGIAHTLVVGPRSIVTLMI